MRRVPPACDGVAHQPADRLDRLGVLRTVLARQRLHVQVPRHHDHLEVHARLLGGLHHAVQERAVFLVVPADHRAVDVGLPEQVRPGGGAVRQLHQRQVGQPRRAAAANDEGLPAQDPLLLVRAELVGETRPPARRRVQRTVAARRQLENHARGVFATEQSAQAIVRPAAQRDRARRIHVGGLAGLQAEAVLTLPAGGRIGHLHHRGLGPPRPTPGGLDALDARRPVLAAGPHANVVAALCGHLGEERADGRRAGRVLREAHERDVLPDGEEDPSVGELEVSRVVPGHADVASRGRGGRLDVYRRRAQAARARRRPQRQRERVSPRLGGQVADRPPRRTGRSNPFALAPPLAHQPVFARLTVEPRHGPRPARRLDHLGG